MAQRVLILLALVCCGSCFTLERWLGWKKLHSKYYESADEEHKRMEVWRDNYRKILEHNNANYTFKLGLNEFADMVSVQHNYRELSVPDGCYHVYMIYCVFVFIYDYRPRKNSPSSISQK